MSKTLKTTRGIRMEEMLLLLDGNESLMCPREYFSVSCEFWPDFRGLDGNDWRLGTMKNGR